MPTFIYDLITIQGIFHRYIKIANNNANTSASVGASTRASVSKELRCEILNLTYLACQYDAFLYGYQKLHRKTSKDADEDLIIHPMVHIALDPELDVSPTYTPNMPVPMLRSTLVLEK